MDDEIIRGATITKNGEITWPPPPPKISVNPTPKKNPEVEKIPLQKQNKPWGMALAAFLVTLCFLGIGSVAPPEFMNHLTVFVLACFVGYMVVWNVTPALHTPLMSVTNAVSSIIIIGALLQISSDNLLIIILAAIAILITSVNIFGGFAVTQRMLSMFRK